MLETVPPPQIQTHTILIIDDEAKALDTWAIRLQECSNNYTVLKANSIIAALDLCRHRKVHCVVLDLELNDESGFEVLFALVPDRQHREIAVVVLTHLSSANLHEMAVEYGAHACLVKRNTTPQFLHRAIQAAIASVQGQAN